MPPVVVDVAADVSVAVNTAVAAPNNAAAAVVVAVVVAVVADTAAVHSVPVCVVAEDNAPRVDSMPVVQEPGPYFAGPVVGSPMELHAEQPLCSVHPEACSSHLAGCQTVERFVGHWRNASDSV